MGGALAEGLMKSETISPSDLTISDPSEKALARFSQSGASITTDNLSAIEGATTLFIVVKPWLVQQVIEGILPAINGKRLTIVVIAAGIHSTDLCQWLRCDDNKDFNVFLAIPNTAIAVGESMTFLVPVKATAETTNQISDLFGHVGECLVTEERLLAAGTTLASCGIAYAMRYVLDAARGGVEMGFDPAEAVPVVCQTMIGAIGLMTKEGADPEAEIVKVCTPGGLTLKGLKAMEEAGFTEAIIRGLKASVK